MTITITGLINLGELKEIINENLEYIGNLELYIPYDSLHELMEHEDIQRNLIYMNPRDLMDGRITLYGAGIHGYFPEILTEEEN